MVLSSSGVANSQPYIAVVADIEPDEDDRAPLRYGARAANTESHGSRLVAWREAMAAAAPTVTSVMARPIEKQATSTAPSVSSFSWRQIRRTVIAAGQGSRPPVIPNRMICHVDTC